MSITLLQQIAGCVLAYAVLVFAIGFFAVTGAAGLIEARDWLNRRRANRDLDQRLLEDEQVATLDALWELPAREGRVA